MIDVKISICYKNHHFILLQVRFSLCVNMVLILVLAFLIYCCKDMSLTICHNSTIYLNSDSHAVLSLGQSRIREILYTIKNRSVIGESRISPDNRRNAVCVTWGLTWGELVGYLEKTWRKYLEIQIQNKIPVVHVH